MNKENRYPLNNNGHAEHTMARVRRQFVSALIVDAILTSYIVFAALLHATWRHEKDERLEMTPFLAHLGHGFIVLFGLVGIWLPGLSFPSRSLRILAPVTFLGDCISATMHVSTLTVDRLGSECTVYTVMAICLVLSSVNVYWRASRELETFNDLRR